MSAVPKLPPESPPELPRSSAATSLDRRIRMLRGLLVFSAISDGTQS